MSPLSRRKKQPNALGYPVLNQILANPRRKVNTDDRHKLAFDLSSSCVGWALLVNGQLEAYGKLVFKKAAPPGEKIIAFYNYSKAMIESFEVDTLVCEAPLSRMGATTKRHFELLGVLRYLWKEYGREIEERELLDAREVKKAMQVKKAKGHEQNKRAMVEKINNLCGLHLNFHKTDKHISWDDAADAIAVAIAHERLFGGK